TAASLSLIKRGVGDCEELEVVRLICGYDRADAYRRPYLRGFRADWEIGNAAAYSFCNRAQIFDGAIREDREKFFAAVASNIVIGADGLADAIGGLFQDFVARHMAVGVVHVLKVIEVDHQDPRRGVRPCSALNLSSEQVQSCSPAPDTGKSVMGCIEAKRFA